MSVLCLAQIESAAPSSSQPGPASPPPEPLKM
eukprot:COSAG01_NODE_5779_length_4036_cov_256.771654_7_plen_31_part_01